MVLFLDAVECFVGAFMEEEIARFARAFTEEESREEGAVTVQHEYYARSQ